MTLRTIKLTTLAALAVASFATPSQAALTHTNGDLFVGFREIGNTTNDYLINLGTANQFRDAVTPINITLTNFATDASAAFGGSWATDNILWGFVGANANTGASAGNPGRTLFLSEPIGTTPIASSSQSGQTLKYNDLKNDWLAQTQSAVTNASIGAPGDANSWTNNIVARLNNPIGLTPIETSFATALDLFRVTQTNNPGPNVTNEGQFTFNKGTGVLTFTPFGFAAPVPEPSTALFGALALGSMVIRRRRAVVA